MQSVAIKRADKSLNDAGIHHNHNQNNAMNSAVVVVRNAGVSNGRSNLNGHGNASAEFELRKGPWMPEEDEILIEYVRQYGPRDWSSIRSKGLLPRTGKSCRLRWVNKLKPDLKSGCKFSPEEEKLVVEMQAKLGNKWAKIASYLPGRTDNDVKNFWSTRQKRIMRAMQRPKPQHAADTHDPSKNPNVLSFSNLQVETGLQFQAMDPFSASSSAALPFHPFPVEMTMEMITPNNNPHPHRHSFSAASPYHHEMNDMMMVKLQDLVAAEPLLINTPPPKPNSNPNHSHNPEMLEMQSCCLSSVVTSDETSQSSAMSSTDQKPNKKTRPSREDSYLLDLSTVTKRPNRNQTLAFSLNQPYSDFNNFSTENSHCNNSHNDLGVDLYIDPNDSNILDFFLQPKATDSMTSKHSSEDMTLQMAPLPGFLSNQSFAASSACPVKEEHQDSCTPDCVLAPFPVDVFDCLEPLSCSPHPEWWESRI